MFLFLLLEQMSCTIAFFWFLSFYFIEKVLLYTIASLKKITFLMVVFLCLYKMFYIY